MTTISHPVPPGMNSNHLNWFDNLYTSRLCTENIKLFRCAPYKSIYSVQLLFLFCFSVRPFSGCSISACAAPKNKIQNATKRKGWPLIFQSFSSGSVSPARHHLRQPLPLLRCHGTDQHPPPSSTQNNSRAGVLRKTFHGLTTAITKRSGGTSVPVADFSKSLLRTTTGMISKQLYLIKHNRNWQVSKNAQTPGSPLVCCVGIMLSRLERKWNSDVKSDVQCSYCVWTAKPPTYGCRTK